ncbi:unnamed protein product [Adineta steineri]|uniref:Uncharacterized protein n=1 Tax=Adineta steineri TaxID=433720 RepID=A0A815SY42_9BILA|nr:unnamed protein product [Adineta steineri]CAF1643943.1 unnamed protein product [Adineta steineri]
MLIEKANHAQTQVQLVPYCGMVNPEHMNQMNCVPMVMMDDDDDKNLEISYLEKLFLEDFLRKSNEFRQTEQIDSLPIEIRLGTVYTYQNRRQQNQYPDSLYCQNLSVDSLRNEERRARDDKHFLITFNKNKGINDIDQFEHELTCTGFRETHNQQLTYRLYLCYEKKTYSTKFTHIDVVKSKYTSNFPKTFDDIYDIRTSIGKALDEEELHINDGYCDFLHIKDLENCVFETISCNGQFIYHFNRHLVPYFDFFQIKQTRTFDYSCYDLNSSAKTTTPCLQTNNVILAKLLSNTFTEEEAKRIWTIGAWLSDLSTRCTNRFLPANKISCRRPGRTTTHRRAVR